MLSTPLFRFDKQKTRTLYIVVSGGSGRGPLLILNARNEHDREKFVEDLRESIAEMDEMERLRIDGELEKQRLSVVSTTSLSSNGKRGATNISPIGSQGARYRMCPGTCASVIPTWRCHFYLHLKKPLTRLGPGRLRVPSTSQKRHTGRDRSYGEARMDFIKQ